MRIIIGSCLISLLLVLSSLSGAQAADLAWLTVDRVDPAASGDYEPRMVVTEPGGGFVLLSPTLVSLYRVGQTGRLETAGSFVADPDLSALAADDVDSDGALDFVTARGEEGALAVDRWFKNQRFSLGSPRYAWTRLGDLRVLSTQSGKQLVAAGRDGGLWSYLVSGRGLEPLGTVEPRQRFKLYGVADLDADGQQELLAGAGPAEIAVYRWAPGSGWLRGWQNYPWGGTAAAAVGDLDQDAWSELAVWSRERILYLFAHTAEGGGLELKWQGALPLPAGDVDLVYLPGAAREPGAPPPALAARAGESLYLLSPSSKLQITVTRLASVGVRGVFPLTTKSGAGSAAPRLIVLRTDGSLDLVASVPSELCKAGWVWADGRVEAAGVLWEKGRLHVGLREAASRLGLVLRWDAANRLTEVLLQDGRTVALAEGRLPLVDGVQFADGGQVLVRDGRTYIDAGLLDLFMHQAGAAVPRLTLLLGDRRFPLEALWQS